MVVLNPVTAFQESYDIETIMETWWDSLHDWSAAIDGNKLFRRDRKEGEEALPVRELCRAEGSDSEV